MLAASPEAGGGQEPPFRCRAACQPLTPPGDPLAGLPGQLERPLQHEGHLGCPPGLSSGSQKGRLCSHCLPLAQRQGTVLGNMGALVLDAGSCCKCSFVHPSWEAVVSLASLCTGGALALVPAGGGWAENMYAWGRERGALVVCGGLMAHGDVSWRTWGGGA